jgi:hypothetical protein
MKQNDVPSQGFGAQNVLKGDCVNQMRGKPVLQAVLDQSSASFVSDDI